MNADTTPAAGAIDRSPHPLAALAVHLITEGEPASRRVNAETFMVLLGAGRHRGERTRAWLKVAADLLEALHAEGYLNRIELEGQRLYGPPWPERDAADAERLHRLYADDLAPHARECNT